MADMNEFNNIQGDVVSGVDTITKKKKGPLIAGITAGVIGVAAGGGVLAYNLSDFVKNQVKLRLSKPEKYYSWVVEKNSNSFASKASEEYKKSLELRKKGSKASVSVKYELGSEVKSLLSDAAEGMGDADLEKLVKSIDSVTVGSSADTKGTEMSGNAFVKLNDDQLVTIDMAMDMSSFDTFMRVPELTEKWLGIDGSMFTDQLGANEMTEMMESYGKAFDDPESLLSPDELEDIINRYTNVWSSNVQDVQLEKKSEIEIGDFTMKYTVASVELTEAKAKDILTAFSDELKNDETIKAIAVDRMGVVTKDVYNEAISNLADTVADLDGEGVDSTLTIDTYIDPNGDIRGFGMSAEEVKVYFVIGKDGDKICGEGYVKEDGEELFRIDINGTASGKKSDCTVDVTADGETVSVEFTDYEVVDEEKGYCNGDITIKLPESADVAPITINCSSDGSSQVVSGGIKIDGKDYGKVILEIAADFDASPSIPSKSDAFMADENSELSDYVSQEDIEKYLTALFDKLGLTGDNYKDIPAMLAESAMGGGMDDDFGGFGDDDFAIDDDFGGFGDDDFTIDDWNINDDPSDNYADTRVGAVSGQGYIFVYDRSQDVSYTGQKYDNLSYDAVNADITGDGEYTVKVTTDSEGFKAKNMDVDGISMLCIQLMDVKGIENADLSVKSVKVDGKEYKITAEPDITSYTNTAIINVYFEGIWGDNNIVDLKDIGAWKDIEITFEVKGL